MSPSAGDHHDHGSHQAVHHSGHHAGHHAGHERAHHGTRAPGSVNAMAASATLHCLTGCAIGEIAGMMIGTAAGLSNTWTVTLSVALAFFFGYALSTLPLLKAGLGLGSALGLVLAADTLSIAVMEVVDNLVMVVIPGAMEAGLVNVVFWLSMMLALAVAFVAAYPVNRYLLQRGKGHALTHAAHGGSHDVVTAGARRFIPSFSTPALVAVIVAFLLGGLVVSVADEAGAPAHGGADDRSVPRAA